MYGKGLIICCSEDICARYLLLSRHLTGQNKNWNSNYYFNKVRFQVVTAVTQDRCVLRRDVIQTGGGTPTFRSPAASITLIKEAAWFSGTSLYLWQNLRCDTPENGNPYFNKAVCNDLSFTTHENLSEGRIGVFSLTHATFTRVLSDTHVLASWGWY